MLFLSSLIETGLECMRGRAFAASGLESPFTGESLPPGVPARRFTAFSSTSSPAAAFVGTGSSGWSWLRDRAENAAVFVHRKGDLELKTLATPNASIKTTHERTPMPHETRLSPRCLTGLSRFGPSFPDK
jgi:hypothetical protein